MPELTRSDKIRMELRKLKLSDITTEIKQDLAKKYECSYSLVQKIYNERLREAPEEAGISEAKEPVVSVEEEPEVVVEEVEEKPSEFEVPKEFGKPAEEKPLEEKPAEVVMEEEELEQQQLREVSKRAIKRVFGVIIEEGFGLGKDLGLTDQEAEDTEIVTMLLLAKYLKMEITENLLEIASGLHFGSLGLKLLVGWIKKRRAEVKKREEEEKLKESVEKRVETPTSQPSEEEAKQVTEEAQEKQKVAAEKAYVKKVTGGE